MTNIAPLTAYDKKVIDTAVEVYRLDKTSDNHPQRAPRRRRSLLAAETWIESMRKIEAAEAAERKLPTHEHHDQPENKVILDTLQKQPGSWFHVPWDEIGEAGNHETKMESLHHDSAFRDWTLHTHIIPGNPAGGVYLMRDLMD